jgi:hypothetical protein
MNNPEQINNNPADVTTLDEMGQQTAGELLEIESSELEQVSGGGGGTAVGWS